MVLQIKIEIESVPKQGPLLRQELLMINKSAKSFKV